MKKYIVLGITLALIMVMACACGETTPVSQTTSTTSAQEGNEVEEYMKPADTVSLDLTKEDPSTETMKLVYDDMGRVSQCYYSINGKEAYVNYEYSENAVQIFAFLGSIVVDDVSIQLPAFDANKGFSIIEGYYFKGYAQ